MKPIAVILLALFLLPIPNLAQRVPLQNARCATCSRNNSGRIVRGATARRKFMRQSGYPKGRPGHVIDHIVPLACGGADAPENMQWQTLSSARIKDKTERKNCR